MERKKEVIKFKNGEILHLDQIMYIQGLAGGDWWEKTGNDIRTGDRFGSDMGDEVVITKDIKITIIYEKG